MMRRECQHKYVAPLVILRASHINCLIGIPLLDNAHSGIGNEDQKDDTRLNHGRSPGFILLQEREDKGDDR